MSEYKRATQSETNEAQISTKMLSAIHNEMLKFKTIEDFLVSVKAIRKDNEKEYIAFKFHNSEMSEYEEKFVKKFNGNISDGFVFDKYAKQQYEDESKKIRNTGFFYPISFWKYVAGKIEPKKVPLHEYIERKTSVDNMLKELTKNSK